MQPKLSFGEDDEDDKDDEVGDDIDKEGFSTAAKEELQWSESDLNAAKVLLDFEPDLTEEAEPPEVGITSAVCNTFCKYICLSVRTFC